MEWVGKMETNFAFWSRTQTSNCLCTREYQLYKAHVLPEPWKMSWGILQAPLYHLLTTPAMPFSPCPKSSELVSFVPGSDCIDLTDIFHSTLQGVPPRLDPTPTCCKLFTCLRHMKCRYAHRSWGTGGLQLGQMPWGKARGSLTLSWQHQPSTGPAAPACHIPPPQIRCPAPKVEASLKAPRGSPGRSPTCISGELLENQTSISTNSSSISNEWLIVFKLVHCIFWERIYDLPKNFLLKLSQM